MAVQVIACSRVQGRKVLLENPARESRAKKERQEKRLRRRKHQERMAMGIIGRKEAKEKGVWRFDPAQAR
jgi:ribonuclease P protein subunit POP4